jgi:hypothetical protein
VRYDPSVQTSIILSIRDYCKTIPYTPAEREESTCHGFTPLKGAPREQIAAIPEVQDLPCLREALVTINAPQTSFFTIGCEKAFNPTSENWWAKGYLEFAYNDRKYAIDAQWYFKAFFDFTHYIWQREFDAPVQFHWELNGAQFMAASFTGYSVMLWVQTAELASENDVKQLWCAAVSLLAEYLAQITAPVDNPIYKVDA